jgi:hypothetical protein
MRLSKAFIPIGALTLALGVGGSVSEAAQRDSQDRGGRQSEGHARPRSRSGDQQNGARDQRDNNNDRAARDNGRQNQSSGQVERRENDGNRRGNDGWNRGDDRRGSNAYRGYIAPRSRVEVVRPRFNRHYGPGFSVFFGLGSGYRYGSPYDGRVYGYVPAPVYGARIYYGDVRLQVRPRDAAVFVDGYYAGIVDDFDGVFQRLTLTVGPHEIAIEAPGLQPQVYNVYVDPARTVDVRADLSPAFP